MSLTRLFPNLSAENVNEAILSFWYFIFDVLAYLVDPPPSSWVSRVSSALRMSAFLLILPWAFLISLDIISYLVARTLGVDTTHDQHDLPSQELFDGDEFLSSMQMLFDSASEQSSPTKEVDSHLSGDGTNLDGNSATTTSHEERGTTVLLRKRARSLTVKKEYNT